jgi:predicted dienelactone hydrolase
VAGRRRHRGFIAAAAVATAAILGCTITPAPDANLVPISMPLPAGAAAQATPGSPRVPADAHGAGYAAPGGYAVRVADSVSRDPSRNRSLPLRLRVPQPCTNAERRPVLLFSHGLGGSRVGGARWGEHWASHGFVVMHLQHPGSDESLWRSRSGGLPIRATLQGGATIEQFVLRAQDVRFAIDALRGLAETDPALACLDMTRLGMSGHSFGAQTTQAVVGQSLPSPGGGAARAWLREPRILAAVAFSPSMRDDGAPAQATFATVRVPFLAVTGGRDGDVLGTGVTPALRRAVFDALPPGDRYLLWFGGGDHMVFNGGPPRPPAADRRDDDIRVQGVTAAVTLAFWRATLSGDAAARAWLDAGGPRLLLGEGDGWASR